MCRIQTMQLLPRRTVVLLTVDSVRRARKGSQSWQLTSQEAVSLVADLPLCLVRMQDLATTTQFALVLIVRYIANGFVDVTSLASDVFVAVLAGLPAKRSVSKTVDVSAGCLAGNVIRTSAANAAWLRYSILQTNTRTTCG